MNLTDLAPLAAWRALEESFHENFGLDINVFDTKGYRITDVKNWVNRLCPAIKATDKGQSYICAVAHTNLAAMAEKSRHPVVEECDGGLMKFVVPIFVDDQFIGVVGGCGVLLEDGEVDSFLINRTTDMEEAQVEQLAEGIPSISREAVQDFIGTVGQRINQLVQAYKQRAQQ